jgi:hypothetical protein
MTTNPPPSAFPPERRRLPHVAAVGFDLSAVEPAGSLYIGLDDQLLLRVHNSVAGLVLHLRARFQTPDGQVAPQDFVAIPTTSRALFEQTFRLGEGFLLGVAVRGESGVARRGACFVQVLIVRGGAAADQPVETLVADYLAEGQLIGAPGGNIRQSTEGPGRMRIISGTDPAAGSEVTETVPTGARWRLQSLRVQLVTSAVVNNRRVHLVIDDGIVPLLDLAAADTQAASLTRNYNVDPSEFQRVAQDNEIYIPVVSTLILSAGARIRTVTTLLDGGDNYGAPQYVVEEWIEP